MAQQGQGTMWSFDPESYGPVFAPLLSIDRCRELGPGKPDPAVRPVLEALTPDYALPRRIADRQMALLCCGAVWLLYDYLEESHRISQSVETAAGSYWHGLMHRRELDFGNAKYWFRHTGRHPIFEPLHEAARSLAQQAELDWLAAPLASQSQWEPFLFVDLCEAVAEGRSASGPLCRAIQQREWELLFDYCFRHAIGKS